MPPSDASAAPPVDAPPIASVRFGRPTDQLDACVRFYHEGIGLPIIGRFTGHAGFDGVLLGLPDERAHLELTHQVHGSPGAAPTADHNLVLYLRDGAAVERVVARLATMEVHPVTPENPYWSTIGAVTVRDPDGWNVVLCPRPTFHG